MAAGTWTAITGDRAMTTEQKQIFVLRTSGPPGATGIQALRALLKTLLKRHKFRALDVREEHHDAPPHHTIGD